MEKKLTKAIVDGLAPGGAPYFVWDAGDGAVKGFGLVVHPSGRRVFVAQFRIGRGRGAKSKRVTIGTFGAWTVETARTAARAAIQTASTGVDVEAVADAAEAAREAAAVAAEAERRARRDRRIDRLAARFMSEHTRLKRKPNTILLYKGLIVRNIFPAFARRDACDLTRAEISRWHAAMADKPATANRALAALSAILNWAIGQGLVPDDFRNPTERVEKFKEYGKERFLSVDELRALGDAVRLAETAGIEWQPPRPDGKTKHLVKPENRFVFIDASAAAAIRLLIFTGARLREILDLEWSSVDLDRGLLRLKDSKTGPKTILLNPPARAVLAGLDRTGRFVLKGDGDHPRSDIKRPWKLVCRAAGLINVRPHDLRHSFASVGAADGHGLLILGKLLGHSQAATTAKYAHFDNDPLRKASDAIARSIAASMGEAPAPASADVLPFRKGGA